jgi:hypothetical protein
MESQNQRFNQTSPCLDKTTTQKAELPFQRQLGFPTEHGPVAFRHCLAAALALSLKKTKSLQKGEDAP